MLGTALISVNAPGGAAALGEHSGPYEMKVSIVPGCVSYPMLRQGAWVSYPPDRSWGP
jgi:hypothetical protein